MRSTAVARSIRVARVGAAWIAMAGLWTACAASIRPPIERLQSVEILAADAGFERVVFDESASPEAREANDRLPVAAWRREGADANSIHVYIEGDGLAWRSRHRISDDPTPIRPTGLMLAAADPSRATVVYLGRPCQYTTRSHPGCRPRVWSRDRFGEAVLRAVERRLSALLEDRPETHLSLVGYSGGGVVATLVAARRAPAQDVELLVTIAAPLDIDGWTRQAGVSRLAGSLSPMDVIERLSRTRQVHFVGGADSVVPPATTEAFQRAQAPSTPSRIVLVENMDHPGWPAIWAGLARKERLFPADAGEDGSRLQRESSTPMGHASMPALDGAPRARNPDRR